MLVIPTLGYRLPQRLAVPLFGDRKQWGQSPVPGDPCWREWQSIINDFDLATQRDGVRLVMKNAGYRIMGDLDLAGKAVLEIGPGTMAHMRYWRGWPAQYDLFDVTEDRMREASRLLTGNDIPHAAYWQPPSPEVAFPVASGRYDVIVAFYSLEHLHPLSRYMAEIVRVLKPGGYVVGAIPCEGGISFGLARLLSTRRWFRKHSTIEPDKWICWEHPNFADAVVRALDAFLERAYISCFPLPFLPCVDLNLIVKVLYRKRRS
jgi:SAM-dependent methyltransferase